VKVVMLGCYEEAMTADYWAVMSVGVLVAKWVDALVDNLVVKMGVRKAVETVLSMAAWMDARMAAAKAF
jgi:hypothetical protein